MKKFSSHGPIEVIFATNCDHLQRLQLVASPAGIVECD